MNTTEAPVHTATIEPGWRCAACVRPAEYQLDRCDSNGEPLHRSRATTACDAHWQLVHDWLAGDTHSPLPAKVGGRIQRMTLGLNLAEDGQTTEEHS